MLRLIFILVIFFVSNIVFAQIGGRAVYSFLDLNYSARNAALGMNMIPVFDNDINNALANPSFINENSHKQLGFTATNYLSDISYGSAVYGHNFNSKFYSLAAIRYINYGDFIRSDEYGNKIGEFKAGEYALNMSVARKLTNHIRTGACLKFIYSTYDKYNSSALGLDYAISYINDKKLFTSTLIIRNLGLQLYSFTGNNPEPLPLDIQIGFSKKPEHMPLRFIVLAHHLNIPNFAYIDPDKKYNTDLNGNPVVVKVPLTEKIFRHFDVGGEFVLSENFNIRLGYSHQHRKELQLTTRPGLAGYSWGFGLKISKFQISYGNTIYHLAGGSNTFSIAVNLSDFTHKDKGIKVKEKDN